MFGGGGSSFGAPSAFGGGGGGFGTGGFGAPAAPTGGGLFGGSAAPQTGGGFGAPGFGGAASGGFGAGGLGGTSSFGSPAPPAGGGLFGGAPATSGFGAAPGGGLFGGGATQQTGFGAPQTSAFGAQATGTGFGAGGGAFGQPQQSGFGATGGAFGAPSTGGAFGIQTGFGTNAAGAFGTGAAAPGGMFGAQTGGAAPAMPPFNPQNYLYRFEDDQYLSINAKPENMTQSIEEIRLKDYQQGNRGPGVGGAPGAGIGGFGTATTGGGGSLFGGGGGGTFGGTTPGAAGGFSLGAPAAGTAPGGGAGLFGGPSNTSTFGTGGSSLFGGTNTAAAPFGTPAPGQGSMFGTSTATGGGLFGGGGGMQSGAGGGGLFGGGGGGTTGGGGLFGSQQPSSSLFGSTPSQGSSLFGGGTQSSGLGGGGLFGGQPQQMGSANRGGGGLFGGGGSLGSSFTGASSFASPQPGGGGLFGGAGTSTLGSTPFGTSSGAPGGGLFGGAPTSGLGGGGTSLFGTSSSLGGGLGGSTLFSSPGAGAGGLGSTGGFGNASMTPQVLQQQVALPAPQPYISDPMLRSAEMLQNAWKSPNASDDVKPQSSQSEKRDGQSGLFSSPALIATPLREEARTLSIAPRSATFLLHSGRKTPAKTPLPELTPMGSSKSKPSSLSKGATPGSAASTPVRLPSIRAKTPLGRDRFAQIALGSSLIKSPQPDAGDKAAASEGKAERARNPRAPVIVEVHKGYSVRPSIEQLAYFSDEQLASVKGFTVSREDAGSVTWLNPVDVRDLRIGEDVQILSGEGGEDETGIIVHPDRQVPRGQRLNTAARCQVYIRDDFPNATTPKEEQAMLLQLCDSDGLVFCGWEPETRCFTYEVDCFQDFEEDPLIGRKTGLEVEDDFVHVEQDEVEEVVEEEYDAPAIDDKVKTYGYSTKPSVADLQRMPAKELKKIKNFVVEREGLGKIEWLEPVDVRGIVVGKDITIDDMAVEVTSSRPDKPLNKPARCSLHLAEKFSQADLKSFCEEHGVQFIQWDSDSNTLVFQVDDFSKLSGKD